MYGWRGKLGIILPSNNTVLEPEAYRALPDGVSAHFARILSHGQGLSQLAAMERNSSRAAEELVGAKVDMILYACLSTTLAKGMKWDGEFAADLQSATGLPIETAALATVRGLKALGATRIALAHPYPAEVGDLLPDYLNSHGISVGSMRAVDTGDGRDVCSREPHEAYALARSAWSDDLDALCIVATDFRTLDVISALEEDLGVPVITTNQALLWVGLRRLGIMEPFSGHGRLLTLKQPLTEVSV